MEGSPVHSEADMTSDPGKPQASSKAEKTSCSMCQETHLGAQDCDPETWHVSFRGFTPSETADPVEDLRRLSELCRLWLRPERHSKEEILDLLVIEQFMISMPIDLQVLVMESGVKRCRDLEEMLRNNCTPRSWEEEVLPETVPENGDLEGSRPEQHLEEDLNEDMKETTAQRPEEELIEDMEETTALVSQEPPLPPLSADSVLSKVGEPPQEEAFATNTDPGTSSSHVPEGENSKEHLTVAKGQLGGALTSEGGLPGEAVQLEDRESLGHAGLDPVNPRGPMEPARHPARLKHLCEVCKRGFRYKSQLLIHQRTHTGERPYTCKFCQKGFMQTSDLRVHQRIHTKEKPFKCKVCGKMFTHESTLYGHRRIHTKEKPYRCEDCQRCFNHKGNLNVHRRIHTNAKPYQCDQCGHAFRQLGTFKRHAKIHSPDSPLTKAP